MLRGNCEDLAEEWERSQLAADDLAWLQSLPLTATLDGVLYCHAAPTSNLPITTAITPDDAVRRTFAGIEGTVVIGHTHHQFDRSFGDLRVVNAGSVGMPYEGEVAAFWTLVEDGEPSFRQHARSTSSGPSRRRARARGRTRRSSRPRTCSSRRSRDEAIAQLESRRT